MKKIDNTFVLSLLGYVILVCGIGNIIIYYNSTFSSPTNVRAALADVALILIGLTSTTAAASLRQLDRRLRRIERELS